ncbi:hypothetical protein ATO4_10461 [Aurantimonas sp. 22II-16-19i]|nr:hypothetical protein ATO4_10461 [Aurantimonas sp. 22II-16-19i]
MASSKARAIEMIFCMKMLRSSGAFEMPKSENEIDALAQSRPRIVPLPDITPLSLIWFIRPIKTD